MEFQILRDKLSLPEEQRTEVRSPRSLSNPAFSKHSPNLDESRPHNTQAYCCSRLNENIGPHLPFLDPEPKD